MMAYGFLHQMTDDADPITDPLAFVGPLNALSLSLLSI